MVKKLSLLLAVLLGLVVSSVPGCGGASAPVAWAEGAGVELTVYNQNFALVKDKRSLDLKEGLNEVHFSEVASKIDPTSVLFRSLTDPQGTKVV